VSAPDRGATEVSENRSWLSIHSLLTSEAERLALVGAPLVKNSISPGRYDLAPDIVRGALRRLSVYDLETQNDLSDLRIHDFGNLPIQALLEDGMPGVHISQIGLAPFANTKKAHAKAMRAGISVRTLSECFERGLVQVVKDELDRLAGNCGTIYVDFDIDVIDRGQMPSAPGARAGGVSARDFFAAARSIAAHSKVRCVDLVEFDPSMDVQATGALTAARWFAEILAGFSARRG
jgi:formiminoglutamase